jgi:site-specific DNA recombinase
MKAAGYVRVSTEEQRDEGYSLSAQRMQVKALCDSKGWELVKVYADEGKSGKNVSGRPALQELLDAVKAHQYDVVVICKLDRLGRNTRQILAIVEDNFTKNGVRLVSIAEGLDPTTPAGGLMLTMLAGLAEFERKQIGERTRSGMAEARKQGKHTGRVGFGWQMNENGEAVPVPEEQRELRRAKRLASRHGIAEAARRMEWDYDTAYYRLRTRKA